GKSQQRVEKQRIDYLDQRYRKHWLLFQQLDWHRYRLLLRNEQSSVDHREQPSHRGCRFYSESLGDSIRRRRMN
ncbi:MAG: hypothetical protein QOI22_1960, partial [Verrucomicrobiota bacterium]